jgi:hypothetical protein
MFSNGSVDVVFLGGLGHECMTAEIRVGKRMVGYMEKTRNVEVFAMDRFM